MKHLFTLMALTASLLLSSCGQSGREQNENEDATGNERGTPGTGTEESGTGQDRQHHIDSTGDAVGATPADSAAPQESH